MLKLRGIISIGTRMGTTLNNRPECGSKGRIRETIVVVQLKENAGQDRDQ
jgi:hypothetical protein